MAAQREAAFILRAIRISTSSLAIPTDMSRPATVTSMISPLSLCVRAGQLEDQLPTLTVNYGVSWDVEYPNLNDQFGGLGINCWNNSIRGVERYFLAVLPGLACLAILGATAPGGPRLITTALAPASDLRGRHPAGPSGLDRRGRARMTSPIRGGYRHLLQPRPGGAIAAES